MSGGLTTYAFVTMDRDVVKKKAVFRSRVDPEGCRRRELSLSSTRSSLSVTKKSFVNSLPSSVPFFFFSFFSFFLYLILFLFILFFFSPSHLPISYPSLLH